MIYVKNLELIQVAILVRYHTILAVRFSCDYLNISVLYFDDTVPREWYRLSGMPIRLFFVPYGNIIEPSIKVPYMEQKQDDYL
jgi:hypothetical protein